MQDKTRAALIAELRAIHQASLQAHLDRDVQFFTRDMSESYHSVSRGDINQPTLEQTEAMFTRYLGATTFSRYEDLQEPVIGIADDGSVGWVMAQVAVSGEQSQGDETVPLNFVSAWIMLYRRVDGRWLRIGDASSFKAAD